MDGLDGWMGRRAVLHKARKLRFLTVPRLELNPLKHAVRSQSLYTKAKMKY
jgi:hypothetical protein